jgi:hypothetical protein
MKQTLEEAARENILFNHRTVDRTLSGKYLAQFGEMNFIQGAEWHAKQSPWIRAKDQLPPVDEENISEQSEPVLVKISGHCEPEILVYNKHYHVWDTSDGDDYSCNISDDDLWMPIPLLPKGGDI